MISNNLCIIAFNSQLSIHSIDEEGERESRGSTEEEEEER